jgi:hypothetical protein
MVPSLTSTATCLEKPQRIGKYPQITQILFQVLCAPPWDRLKHLCSKLFAPKLINSL